MLRRWFLHTALLVGLVGMIGFYRSTDPAALAQFRFYEGRAFAEESAMAIAHNWSADELIKRTGCESAKFKSHKEQLDQSCKLFWDSMGPAKSVTDCQFLRETKYPDGIMQTYLIAMNCENGPVTAAAAVQKINNKWELRRFVARSAQLKPYIDPDPDEFAAYAEKVIPVVSKGWEAANLQSFADDLYGSELKNNPMVQQAVLQSVRGLGEFKELKALELGQKAVIDNRLVYIVQGQAEFENGNASIWLHMVEEQNGWKLHRFNIQGTRLAYNAF